MSAGRSALVTLRRPITFTSYIARQSSGSDSATGCDPNAPPALLTRTCSVGPTFAASADTSSVEVTSQRTAVPSISAASSWTRSARRAAQTTWYPSAARRRAVAAPIPLLAPVTTAVFWMLSRSVGMRLIFASDWTRGATRHVFGANCAHGSEENRVYRRSHRGRRVAAEGLSDLGERWGEHRHRTSRLPVRHRLGCLRPGARRSRIHPGGTGSCLVEGRGRSRDADARAHGLGAPGPARQVGLPGHVLAPRRGERDHRRGHRGPDGPVGLRPAPPLRGLRGRVRGGAPGAGARPPGSSLTSGDPRVRLARPLAEVSLLPSCSSRSPRTCVAARRSG